MSGRLEFSPQIKRLAYQRSEGICECHLVPMLRRPKGCGQKLGVGNVFYEHIIPDKLKSDNSLDNCAALCKTCWKEKTSSYDLPTIAKSNRVRDRARGIKPTRGRRLRSRNDLGRYV